MNRPNGIVVQSLAMLGAIAIVTAAHFSWQTIRFVIPEKVPLVYGVTFLLFAFGGYFIIFRGERNSYQKHSRLTDLTLFLTSTVWGTFFAFPSLYSPYNWAWSWSRGVAAPVGVQLLSGLLVAAGLLGLIGSFVWLGISRSMGQSPSLLRTTGLYRFTRNPQLTSGAFIVIGYAMLRPTWYAGGWIVLYFILACQMVAAEEEHLANVFGRDYELYRLRTPRFIGFLERGKELG